jgi:hypothetical protein
MIRATMLMAVLLSCAMPAACSDTHGDPGRSEWPVAAATSPELGAQSIPDEDAHCIHGSVSIHRAPAHEWVTGECAAKLKPIAGSSECKIEGQDLPAGSQLEIVQEGRSYLAKIFQPVESDVDRPATNPTSNRTPWIQAAMQATIASDGKVKWLSGQIKWPNTEDDYEVYVFLDGMTKKHYRVEFFAQPLCADHTPENDGQTTDGMCPDRIARGSARAQWPVGGGDPGTRTADGKCVWP